jgi:hypothetical protein
MANFRPELAQVGREVQIFFPLLFLERFFRQHPYLLFPDCAGY